MKQPYHTTIVETMIVETTRLVSSEPPDPFDNTAIVETTRLVSSVPPGSIVSALPVNC